MPIPMNQAANELSLADTLTRSEIRCLQLTAQGYDVPAVAAAMSLAKREIEMLLYCAERKLNANNRLHAVCLAINLKIIEADVKEG